VDLQLSPKCQAALISLKKKGGGGGSMLAIVGGRGFKNSSSWRSSSPSKTAHFRPRGAELACSKGGRSSKYRALGPGKGVQLVRPSAPVGRSDKKAKRSLQINLEEMRIK